MKARRRQRKKLSSVFLHIDSSLKIETLLRLLNLISLLLFHHCLCSACWTVFHPPTSAQRLLSSITPGIFHISIKTGVCPNWSSYTSFYLFLCLKSLHDLCVCPGAVNVAVTLQLSWGRTASVFMLSGAWPPSSRIDASALWCSWQSNSAKGKQCESAHDKLADLFVQSGCDFWKEILLWSLSKVWAPRSECHWVPL